MIGHTISVPLLTGGGASNTDSTPEIVLYGCGANTFDTSNLAEWLVWYFGSAL